MGSKRLFYLQFQAGNYSADHSEWSADRRHLQDVANKKTEAAIVLGLSNNYSITEYALTEIPGASGVASGVK